MAEYITKGQALDVAKLAARTGNIVPAMNKLDRLPAADVVEVVRCKDCKFFQNVTTSCKGYCHNTLIGICNIVWQDEFCSRGKKKED